MTSRTGPIRRRRTRLEIDAISATTLREMVATSIETHIEPETLRAVELAEESERTILMDIARTMGAGGAA